MYLTTHRSSSNHFTTRVWFQSLARCTICICVYIVISTLLHIAPLPTTLLHSSAAASQPSRLVIRSVCKRMPSASALSYDTRLLPPVSPQDSSSALSESGCPRHPLSLMTRVCCSRSALKTRHTLPLCLKTRPPLSL